MSLKTRHWIRACAIFLSQETQKEKEEQKAKEQANALQVCIYRTAVLFIFVILAILWT